MLHDDVYPLLEEVGYQGVPGRETKSSITNLIKWVTIVVDSNQKCGVIVVITEAFFKKLCSFISCQKPTILYHVLISFSVQFALKTKLEVSYHSCRSWKKALTHGLLSSIQQHPTVWEPVFVGGKGQPITASSLIGCFEVQHSNSLVKRDAESDTYTHTFVTSYILEWKVGS